MTIGAHTKEAENTEIFLKVNFVLLLFFASNSSQLQCGYETLTFFE